jgi:hypothetical protein
MINARSLTNKFAEPYMSINREERNLAAILYAALLVNDNLTKLLDLVDYDLHRAKEQTIAYYEYAFLRDLWNRGGLDNAGKRELITQLLATNDVQALAQVSTSDWNEHFGCAPLSKVHVQSPGSWALTRYDKNIPDNEEFFSDHQVQVVLKHQARHRRAHQPGPGTRHRDETRIWRRPIPRQQGRPRRVFPTWALVRGPVRPTTAHGQCPARHRDPAALHRQDNGSGSWR